MEEQRSYQIPRKVNAGFRFYGLTWQGCLLMLAMLVVSGCIIFLTSWPVPPKIILSTVMCVGTWYLLTNDFDGYGGFEYLKMWILYTSFSQNQFHLTSSKEYGDPEGRHVIRRIRK
jgi:hypothetical protein